MNIPLLVPVYSSVGRYVIMFIQADIYLIGREGVVYEEY
jgi:hypothetical protein